MIAKNIFLSLLFVLMTGAAGYCQSAFPAVNGKTVFKKTLPLPAEKNNMSIPLYMLVSPSFYSSGLAFFCRQEIKFEKLTKIPFKFRLGSVEQVDYLEGKHR